MPKIVDQTGNKFGRLLVLGLAGIRGKDRLCIVRCDCGIEKEVVQSKLTTKTKPVRSCGCLAKDNHYRTHERTNNDKYPIWNSMVGRCYRESQKSYKDYGGRGVTVCDEWKSNPDSFFRWLDQNGHKKGLQIDRIDNEGPYSPENCRVVAQKENCNNRRDTIKYNLDGEHLTIAQMAEKSDIKYATLYKRIKTLGMKPKEALDMKLWQRLKRGESACPR